MFICKLCDKNYESLLSLSKHLTNNHKYQGGLLQYYIDYENFEIPKCKYCENKAQLYKGLKFRKTCGSENCKKLVYKNKILSEKTKIKISKSMKNVHQKGNHPGWSFINKDINKRSYPEKWFVKNVLEKNKLYSKYVIKEKLPFHKYFLDFAIIDMKVDVEIDGQQHFRCEKSIEHDKKRDDFLLKNGWKVYRIAWLELKNNNQTVVDFLEWLESNNKYRKYDVDEIMSLLKTKFIHGNKKLYDEFRKNKSLERNKILIELVKNSNIEFDKFGWVKKVSDLIGIKEQKVNHWMKKFMCDFYIQKCFKRRPHSLIG